MSSYQPMRPAKPQPRVLFLLLLLTAIGLPLRAQQLTLPVKSNSVRFAAIGDMGTGDSPQYEVARQMVAFRQKFPFDFVIMLGDNIYGGHDPSDFEQKFSQPYKPLLDAGVKFYAALGNHDDPNERFFKPFNMNGSRYYTYKKGNVRFFVLDSDYLDPPQFQWLQNELKKSGGDEWRIAYFHHPLYSSGKTHGSSVELRSQIEPLFIQYGVNVVFEGHNHVYERVKPQHGIYYFTEGAAGQLRRGDIRRTDMTASGFDLDQSFMLVEVAGDQLYFQTITRTGLTVDSGVIQKQNATKSAAAESATPISAASASGNNAPHSPGVVNSSDNSVANSIAAMSGSGTETSTGTITGTTTGTTTSSISSGNAPAATGPANSTQAARPSASTPPAARKTVTASSPSVRGSDSAPGSTAATISPAASSHSSSSGTLAPSANPQSTGPSPAKIVVPEPVNKPALKSKTTTKAPSPRHKKSIKQKKAAETIPPTTP